MFKKMHLICEECLRKLCENLPKEFYTEAQNFVPMPRQGNMPIKVYFRLLRGILHLTDIPINSKEAMEVFIVGLNDDAKKELPPFYAVRPLTDIVSYLSEVEVFKRSIMKSMEEAYRQENN
jgi:hypothetical protein